MAKVRVLVVGCGNMGAAHARAYDQMDAFEICGLVSRGNSKSILNKTLQHTCAEFDDYATALEQTQPDAVCISTYPETHEQYTIMALEAGCHVFLEKPMAHTVAGAERVIEAAQKYNRKVVVGYILRYHPSWIRFIEEAQKLGKPLVMRMNLNQQSHGYMWDVHRNLMQSLSPIVDCGVHYVDVMCQMTRSKPVSVSAIGARLTEEIPAGNYNYGQLLIRFADESVGWYEAGWGPMVSDTAYFVKDVFGPKGAVSITEKSTSAGESSDRIDAHTNTERIKVHRAELDEHQEFVYEDTWLDMSEEPDHQELCNREQRYFLQAIEQDIDLLEHLNDALNSLKIVFACDESVKTGQTVMV